VFEETFSKSNIQEKLDALSLMFFLTNANEFVLTFAVDPSNENMKISSWTVGN